MGFGPMMANMMRQARQGQQTGVGGGAPAGIQRRPRRQLGAQAGPPRQLAAQPAPPPGAGPAVPPGAVIQMGPGLAEALAQARAIRPGPGATPGPAITRRQPAVAAAPPPPPAAPPQPMQNMPNLQTALQGLQPGGGFMPPPPAQPLAPPVQMQGNMLMQPLSPGGFGGGFSPGSFGPPPQPMPMRFGMGRPF